MSQFDAVPRRTSAWEMAIAARRYYLDGKSKSEIADELGISRFRVARLIDEAREQGIARIQVDVPSGLDLDLGDLVARKFGIRRCIAAVAGDDAHTDTLRLLGSAAARVLAGRISREDVLGITWGSTLEQVVEAVAELAPADVVQLVGGVSSSELDVNGVELVRRLATVSRGRAFPLHAPFIVGSVAMAEQLRNDPSLAPTMERFDRVTVALIGIGAWTSGESSLYREFDDVSRDALVESGAVADVGSCVLDGQGAVIEASALERTIAIRADQLRTVGEVIAVAGGPGKVDAIRATLRSGLVHTLVTDSTTAAALLD